jgi:hypothetical protein
MVAAAAVVGIGLAMLVWSRGSSSSSSATKVGGPPVRPGINRDDATLIPAFQKKIAKLFERMRARGYDPYLWEARRSQERALKLAQGGTGIVLSMHLYGAAADIVSESSLWSPSRDFWQALRDEAVQLGLISGRDWTNVDNPHVQAITVMDQAMFRKFTDSEQARFVSSMLA